MEVRKIVLVLDGEMKRADIQKVLQLKNDENFRLQYIIPTLPLGYIEMKYPANLKHPNQKYRLTKSGLELKKTIERRKPI